MHPSPLDLQRALGSRGLRGWGVRGLRQLRSLGRCLQAFVRSPRRELDAACCRLCAGRHLVTGGGK